MLILVDMDGPLCSFDDAIAAKVAAAGHGEVPYDETHYGRFHAASNYAALLGTHVGDYVTSCIDTPGFYRDLPPVDGAPAALEQLEAAGHQVRICTAPRLENATCASDKLDWVADHLGAAWVPKVVICRDKTLVRGDLLIDDRPQVTGALTPSWRHVIWDAPYNRTGGAYAARLTSWGDAAALVAALA